MRNGQYRRETPEKATEKAKKAQSKKPEGVLLRLNATMSAFTLRRIQKEAWATERRLSPE